MKFFKALVYIFLFCLLVNYNSSNKKANRALVTSSLVKQKILSEEEKQNWYTKDIFDDSIPGISLEKAYNLLKDKSFEKVTIAIIDSELDITSERFKNNIWINSNEIPDNNIDDDRNGYVDDIYGWNFIANTNGKYIKFCHFESTRILKKLNPLLKDNPNILATLGGNYDLYRKAQKDYLIQLKFYRVRQQHGNYLFANYEKAYEVAQEYFPNKNYTAKKLDSLYLLLKNTNSEDAKLIYYISDCIKYDLDKDWMITFKYNADNIVQKCLNLTYDERENIGDNSNDINDSLYGSHKLFHDYNLSMHVSQVAGIKVDQSQKKFLKIIPIVVSAHGDEHDKDLAMAIRYAVNNGAKIINLSLGKELSFRKQWIEDIIHYASKNDVLIVYAAGNDAKNVDFIENKYYPNDVNDAGTEIVNNFISVGASTKYSNEDLVAYFTNYNKNQVDIFAPGDSIYVYSPNNNYFYNSETSLATPLVSKTAVLIRSYYPNLSAAKVKQIIMESGVSFDIMVNKPSTSKEKELVPFSSLSKSGKIVNAYNALLMAEEIAKQKLEKK